MTARHTTEAAMIAQQYKKEIAEKKSRTDDAPQTAEKLLTQAPLQFSSRPQSQSSFMFTPDHPKQQIITENIAMMIHKDIQPYCIVEDRGFRAVM